MASSSIPRAFVDNYADALEGLSAEMRRRLEKELERIDWTAPVADVRNELIPIMQAYCGASADVAASLAAEFYDGLREMAVGSGYGAVLAPNYSDSDTEQYVRWAVQLLVDDGPDGAPELVGRLTTRIGYEVKKSAGNTVFRNGERDPRGVRFARVPRGSKTYPNGCPFCQMLASRGFVYRTAETAGELNHYHADCQCMIVPGFGSNPSVEGYEPRDYDQGYQEWLEQDHSEHEQHRREQAKR